MTNATAALVDALTAAGQDFEWYPTTERMLDVVRRDFGDDDISSILDIGAGDGRALLSLARDRDRADLFSIEKSAILQQRQPSRIIPVGCDFVEQSLMALPVDVIFCNPPYSEFEAWVYQIISTAYARRAYLVIPQRWEASALIKGALDARGATATVLDVDDFHDAARQARAVVHIIRVSFEDEQSRYYRYRNRETPSQDPFNVWFDANINTFDVEKDVKDPEQTQLARLRRCTSVPDLVEAYNEEYALMEANYRAIFQLDWAILKELGVSKEGIRDGLKARMAGLKNVYWSHLFERLDAITSRLTTATKKRLLTTLSARTSIAFTADNAYAVVLWAIKSANEYFDEQITAFFRDLATKDGVSNYVSNQRTWADYRWRYASEGAEKNTHFKLDYRIVLPHYAACPGSDDRPWDYPNGLHKSAHDLVADAIAVLGNLGFRVVGSSLSRQWVRNRWEDFCDANGEVVFQVKGFQNGNLQWRFRPDAIKALNIEAGRLLGWVSTPAEAVSELGYTPEEVDAVFGKSLRIEASSVRLLGAGPQADCALRTDPVPMGAP